MSHLEPANSPAPVVPAPLSILRARLRVVVTVSAVVVAIAAGWAIWPLPAVQINLGDAGRSDVMQLGSENGGPSTLASLPALDLDAFNAPLWTVAQPPPLTPAPVAPPPLKLQLLGIDTAQDRGAPVYRAVLYDPDQDKILVLRSGDPVGIRVIKSVDKRSVTLAMANSSGDRSGGADQVLLLHPQDGPVTPAAGRSRP